MHHVRLAIMAWNTICLIAVILIILGFIGRIAWTIGKWLIIIFLVLAVIFLII